MRLQAPCKDCEKRYLGCHSECADYINYNNKQQKVRDERAAMSRTNDSQVNRKNRFDSKYLNTTILRSSMASLNVVYQRM